MTDVEELPVIQQSKIITLRRIAEIVSETLSIDPLILHKQGKGNSSESFAKQLFFFLAANNTRFSFDHIAEFINQAGHDKVVKSKRKIEEIIYKTEQKKIMDEKHSYDLIRRCMNIIIEEGYPVAGRVTPEVLARYYENVAQY